MKQIIVVNAVGEPCPLPVIKGKKALDQASGDAIVEVHVDNKIAVENLMRLGRNRGCQCTMEQQSEKEFVVRLAIGDPCGMTDTDVSSPDKPSLQIPDSSMMIAVSSWAMGEGEEELGKALMKGFIYAVSQADQLPETIVFYNSGIMLTTKGSDSLEDLKEMESQGVNILSCGACLSYYERTEDLQVGAVTNMYQIVEMMEAAGKVIKP